MAKRIFEKRNIRNVQKVKKTYYVSIPVEIMREFKWQERQKVVVKKSGKGKIIITDWKK